MSQTRKLIVAGGLAQHEQAQAFAEVVQRIHHRYAAEVVGAFSLCPFMHDPAVAFGVFCVVMDRTPKLDTAVALVAEAGGQVAHLVYPLCAMDSQDFERFGNRLQQAVVKSIDSPPVHATFHPHMRGSRASAARRIGVVRRAPDPFIQFVPDGVHQGGTSFIDPATLDFNALAALTPAKPKRSLGDLTSEQMDSLEERLRAIHAERNEQYAPFLARWQP